MPMLSSVLLDHPLCYQEFYLLALLCLLSIRLGQPSTVRPRHEYEADDQHTADAFYSGFSAMYSPSAPRSHGRSTMRSGCSRRKVSAIWQLQQTGKCVANTSGSF